MKPVRLLTLLAAALPLLPTTSINGGMLDLLRGEPSRPRISFQRVAFVGSARVKSVEGNAERLVGIDTWKPLEPGVQLAPGDLVRTRQGTIVLRMQESQSFIKVTPNTVLRLVEFDEKRDGSAGFGSEEKTGFIVRGCRGKAYHRAGTQWQRVAVNTVLPLGTEVRTEPNTVIDLFNTETHRPVRIRGSSQLRLQDSSFAGRLLVEPSLMATRQP
jgi:hypothetical protein